LLNMMLFKQSPMFFWSDSDASGTADATFVYQNLASDVLVQLVGVLGTSITATNATTAGLIDLN
jgi:hypothetical protein